MGGEGVAIAGEGTDWFTLTGIFVTLSGAAVLGGITWFISKERWDRERRTRFHDVVFRACADFAATANCFQLDIITVEIYREFLRHYSALALYASGDLLVAANRIMELADQLYQQRTYKENDPRRMGMEDALNVFRTEVRKQLRESIPRYRSQGQA